MRLGTMTTERGQRGDGVTRVATLIGGTPTGAADGEGGTNRKRERESGGVLNLAEEGLKQVSPDEDENTCLPVMSPCCSCTSYWFVRSCINLVCLKRPGTIPAHHQQCLQRHPLLGEQ